MTIPILIDGKERGALGTRREGAYTLFEARCAYVPGVRRLFVFGEGARGCLGVMQPAGGELRLRRKLSRADMRGFPDPIEYAGIEERARPAPAETKGRIATPQPEKAFYFTEEGECYLALPCALRRAPPGTRVRELGGRSYLLFRC